MSEDKNPGDTFLATDIEVLESFEAVRRRPAMYVGSTGKLGLTHLVWETVANVIDEHLAGHADLINVHQAPDGTWTVTDNGRGLDERAIRWFEVIHCGATADGHLPHIHIASWGAGMAVVNSLSTFMRIETWRDGIIRQKLYSRGRPLTEFEQIGVCASRDTGTTIQFLPDQSIFTEADIRYDVTPETLLTRFEEVAALTPGLQCIMQGADYTAPKGLQTMTESTFFQPVTMVASGKVNDVRVELAVSWGDPHNDSNTTTRLFTNYVDTKFSTDQIDEMLSGTVANGRHAAVSIILEHPRFGGPTRQKLVHPEAFAAIQDVLDSVLPQFLADHPELKA